MSLLPAPEATRLTVAPMMDWRDSVVFRFSISGLESVSPRV